MPSGEQLVPLLTTLVCRGPGSNPVPPDLGADTLPTELPRPVLKIILAHDETDQSVGGRKRENPEKNHLAPGDVKQNLACLTCGQWGARTVDVYLEQILWHKIEPSREKTNDVVSEQV